MYIYMFKISPEIIGRVPFYILGNIIAGASCVLCLRLVVGDSGNASNAIGMRVCACQLHIISFYLGAYTDCSG